jgi:2-oxoacid:acceptor oxidoreductase delta subunit (pyruvate/2-ketoisovalerate family)
MEEAKIVFGSEAEMPPMPASVGTTLYNKTGTWRYIRPLYVNKTPPCNYNCPAGEDIVAYVALAAEGRYEEAWQLIMEENPLPGICGRVCPHFCEDDCNRKVYGGTIAIHEIERFLADRAVQEGYRLPPPSPFPACGGGRIAVVGSGPAGLSCAYHLARMGYAVTIFEASDKLGGMMRLIPEYRLPREVLDREIATIIEQGVKIETGQKLGENLSMNELRKFDVVFIAVGQSQSIELKIPGEDASMVLPGITFLAKFDRGEKVKIGQKVVVIGGGNTAMDAARTARRLGSNVAILYRRTRAEMPANDEEIEEALAEGIKVEYLVSPVEIKTRQGKMYKLTCVRMELGEPDESGRRRPVPIPGSEFTIACDTVIPALGQVADLSFLTSAVKHERGRIEISEAGRTTDDRVFAGGDVATGYGTVTHAVGSGKRAALAIDRFLRGEEISEFPPLDRNVSARPRAVDSTVVKPEDINLDYFEEIPRPAQPQIPPKVRVKNFAEVNLGFSEETLREEAVRCFSCGTCNECDNCLIFCPDAAVLRSENTAYVFNYDYCKGCGVCSEECPRDVIVMEEELKWKK